ncbi:MAG: PEGA domain-containing protein [Spirochaetales bacterium]
MKRTLLALFVTLLAVLTVASAGLSAQEPMVPSVFVVTDPMAASLRLDDQPRAETTPVLLRGLKPGNHKLVVFKEGFQASHLEFTVTEGKTTVVTVPLAPDSIVAVFPANPQFEVAGASRGTSGLQFRLPAGRYDLATRGTTVGAQPVFGDEALLTLAPWLGAGLATVAAGSAAIDLYLMSQNSGGVTPFTPVLWVSLGVELAWHWALADRHARWEKTKLPTFAPVAQEGAEKAEFAGPLAERAAQLLADGDLAGSEVLWSRLVRDYPEAAEVPGAWFRLARIHALKGERALASGEYRMVAETLQDPEWFDRAHKALADFALADGQTEEALYHLHQMAFADGYFDPAEIQLQIEELTKEAAGAH